MAWHGMACPVSSLSIMATTVKNISIAKVKRAKFVSIIADPVLDVDHADHLTFILRYVNKEESTAEQLFCFILISFFSANMERKYSGEQG
jgi:hypothetical protein